jgi:asparagine synthase (glutamine-hydrolysing)
MCGISGFISSFTKEQSSGIIKKMTDAIAHRGPDAEGFFHHNKITLGHRRLSIIDTSAAGNQPFVNSQNNIALIFNGEIYNYRELKEELALGFQFTTATDTEVIVAAYLKWGIECIHHFIGMFAFALYDQNQEKLFIVRDRMGIKPVYYYEDDQSFFFASELRALLASGHVPRKLNREAVLDYLRYQTVHAPDTIVSNVKMLMPGYYLVWDGREMQQHQYWNASEFVASNEDKTKHEVKHRVLDLLQSAVELRMRADVPFGAFLSGGIDSSIIVGLMARASNHPVQTFSITFKEQEFDESPYSKLIAKRFKTDHCEIQLSASDFLKTIPDAVAAMDHPSGDGPNTYVVSEVTRREGVKMALSGLGGDEVFAGYDVFKRIYSIEQKKWITSTPKVLRVLAASTLQKFKPGIAAEKIAALLKDERPNTSLAYALSRQLWMDSSLINVQGISSSHNRVKEIFDSLPDDSTHILSKVSLAEMYTYMQNVLLRDTDQMSMKHALEVRVPFLDHRLVEYVLGIKDDIKFPHSPKQLLVESVGDLIPQEIVNRPKMGFTFPWKYWMQNELKDFCEQGLGALKGLEALSEFDVDAKWQDFLAGDKTTTWSRLWPLVVLGHWIRQNEIHE